MLSQWVFVMGISLFSVQSKQCFEGFLYIQMKRSEFRNNAQTIPRINLKGKNLKCIVSWSVSLSFGL